MIYMLIPKNSYVCDFWTKHSWKNHFPKKLNAKNEKSTCRILRLPYQKSTPINYNSPFLGIYEIATIKNQSFIFLKFFSPKFMKIRCCLGIFTAHGRDFQIKLTMYGSSLSLRCVSMSELKLFQWKEVYVQNFDTLELVNFLEKFQRLLYQI